MSWKRDRRESIHQTLCSITNATEQTQHKHQQYQLETPSTPTIFKPSRMDDIADIHRPHHQLFQTASYQMCIASDNISTQIIHFV
jgi:hypothetical protein